jgi:hypothetical protein
MKPIMLSVTAGVSAAALGHRNMKYFATILLGLIIVARGLAETVPAELEPYKAQWQKMQTEIQTELATAKTQAVTRYGENLETVMAHLKGKGDLDTYLVVEQEKLRFDTEKTIPKISGDLRREFIDKAVTVYNETVAEAELKGEQRTAQIGDKYVAALKSLMQKLMVADDIEAAKIVRAELNTAEFIVADAQTRIPAEVAPNVVRNEWISKDATYTVSSQSRWPPLPSLLKGEGTVHDINGHRFAFSTGAGPIHFIIIDLGEPMAVSRVYIQNTVDPNPIAKERARTLTMWTSMGTSFSEMPIWTAKKAEDEWDVELNKPVRARYVKLGLLENVNLHLIQVKIFGWELEGVAAPVVKRRLLPKDAKQFKGHHYLFVGKKVTWGDAKKACEEMGGHLVTITSEKEDDFVNSLAGDRSILIGCTDEEKEGQWIWVTGEKFVFANWAPNDPNGGRAQNYGFKFMRSRGEWCDVEDFNLNLGGYVCEWDY